jgi:subtilisin-like proprotein convertase family protein
MRLAYTIRACGALACATVVLLLAAVPALGANGGGTGSGVSVSGPGTASPYPSTVSVSLLAGTISDVSVTLNNVSGDAHDLGVLLIAPNGATVLLMSNVASATSGSLTFTDSASGNLGCTGTNSTGSYQPTGDEYCGGNEPIFPSAGTAGSDCYEPPGNHPGDLMSWFSGGDPNGTWRLCVISNYQSSSCSPNCTASIGSWTLNITTQTSTQHTFFIPPDTSKGSPEGEDTTSPRIFKPMIDPSTLSRGKRTKATFTYSLSENATVLFTIDRKLNGRRVNGKCVKQTKSNRTHHGCTRLKRVGGFSQNGHSGRNSKTFNGKLDGKRLSVGQYHATLVATDPASNKSKRAGTSFTVVP